MPSLITDHTYSTAELIPETVSYTGNSGPLDLSVYFIYMTIIIAIIYVRIPHSIQPDQLKINFALVLCAVHFGVHLREYLSAGEDSPILHIQVLEQSPKEIERYEWHAVELLFEQFRGGGGENADANAGAR